MAMREEQIEQHGLKSAKKMDCIDQEQGGDLKLLNFFFPN